MLPLTKEQRVKVEENMGLVGKVIGDCVHTLDKGCIYTCDDLFQTGCIGLCKAAQTDRAEATATGTTAKGIRAIRMHIDGYSRKEIGQRLVAPANHVTAWISKARNHIRMMGQPGI